MYIPDDIVISGISGRFPECRNVDEFKEALFRGEDLLTVNDKRFPPGINGLPPRMGKVPDIDKFDAAFFEFHSKQANFTDPRHRILIETVYEAIVDGGYNPKELRGTKTGVFIGLTFYTNFNESCAEDNTGYSILGIGHCSAANRISYCFDFNGPSYALDTGCSSSLYAFTQAVDLLKKGEIEHAIVGGTHLALHPEESLQYNNLNMLSPDGKCKVFSKERNGFARSEAICCYLLQKKSNSRRVYATVLGAKTNNSGYVKEGYTYPLADMQFKLLKELYEEVKVRPEDVAYIELHGTGSRVGDINECQSIVNMFCEDRKNPLLVGSVKSNMGHGEGASGLAALTKVIIAMETGMIPANIHMDPVDEDIPGIRDGKLQIVTRNTKWKPNIVGINSFGIGGANAHVILKANDKKYGKNPIERIHRLVQVSGRTEEAVNHFLDQVQKHASDEEFLSLVDEIHKINIEGHYFRGFTVLGDNSSREITTYEPEKRPIWFIYSGMGSHWPGMGKNLMKFEVFRDTFNRCAAAVEPYGIDLVDVVMAPSPSKLENLGNCFSAIIAISIALTNLLASLGIKPDFFAGHSLGEVGCAYANGDLTPEQAVLLAYSKYYAVKQEKLPLGQMAVVGLSKEEIKEILPTDIFIACQNNRNNVTITGPEQSVHDFVKELTNQGIIAKFVYTCRTAFHSKYLMDSDQYMMSFVRKVIPHPKMRSKKWVTTSVSPENMNEEWVGYNCAEYHTNNYKNIVLFDRIYEQIQSNAIVIEIAPHGILRTILKRELGPENTLISLLDKSSEKHDKGFLSSIGRIFNAGGQPNLRKLYEEIEFPVSSGTKMIAPLVEWDHTVSWFVPYWKNEVSSGHTVTINLSDEKYSYLKGHNINGEILMPATGFLEMVWRRKGGMHLTDSSKIVFENVVFKSKVVLHEKEDVKFIIRMMEERGYFEIFSSGSLIVTGNIRVLSDITNEFKIRQIGVSSGCNQMKTEDFYRKAYLSKHFYSDVFQGIIECNIDGTIGKIKWMDNYVAFLDSMMQLSLVEESSRNIMLPCKIRKLVIDVSAHNQDIEQEYIDVRRDPYCNIVKCKGIEIYGVESERFQVTQKSQANLVMEEFKFVPFNWPQNDQYDFNAALNVALQIVIQNIQVIKVLTIGRITTHDDQENDELIGMITNIMMKQVMTKVKYSTINLNAINNTRMNYELLIIDANILQKVNVDHISNILEKEGFLLFLGQLNLEDSNFEIIFRSLEVTVVRFKRDFPVSYDTINIRNTDFKWLKKLKTYAADDKKTSVFLFSQNDDTTGIIGLQNCLLAEASDKHFKAVCIMKSEADIFSVDDEFYREQLSKGLVLNVLKDNNWGTFVYFPLKAMKPMQSENAMISMDTVGNLSTIRWIQTPAKSQQHIHSEEVEVHYSALNINDIERATGQLMLNTDGNINFGSEYSGTIQNKRRVMGIVTGGSLSLKVTSHPDFTWDIPSSWTLEEAATVPSTYVKCFYGLLLKGKLKEGDTILIHNASTAIGIAAISIATSLNTKTFVTVNSDEEQILLKKLYPHLEDANFGRIYDSSYESLIKRSTQNVGVDIVVNTSDGEFLETSLNCLAKGGSFLEFGTTANFNKYIVGSNITLRQFSFHKILLNDIFDEVPETRIRLKTFLRKGIESGVVKPIPVPSNVFEITQIEQAFKSMNGNSMKEPVLIRIRNKNIKNPQKVLSYPKLYFNPDKTYIIIGGLEDIGLELTNWLIEKGARKIIINARKTIWNGYQALCMKKWSTIVNLIVKIDLSETTNITGAENLVNCAQDLGPVGGIFHVAQVLIDTNVTKHNVTHFKEVFKSKIISGQNMDTVTRNSCPSLDHFVVFSTIAAGREQIGQLSCGMANSALERLCEKRKKDHFPGIAIQWGPIDVGRIASTNKNFLNMVPQSIESCLDTLEKFILQGVTVGSSMVLKEEKKNMTPTAKKTCAETVADILGITNFDSLNKKSTLSQLGLDSLMLAEIKHALYRNFKLNFGPNDIRDITFERLMNLQSDESKSGPHTHVENFPPPLLSKTPILKINDPPLTENSIIVFMVHPIEGYLHYLMPLANNLKTVVYGLQCTEESHHETIQETAKYFLKLIKTVQSKGPYYLCGYSYGATLGFEMGVQLEMEGENVELVAIDGAPDYARQVFSNVGEINQIITKLFPTLFKEVNLDKIKPIISQFARPEESLASIFEVISKETGLLLKDVRDAGEHYFSRCYASFHYHPSRKFRGKIILVRRSENPQAISDDYGLHKICSRTVEVFKLNGDHITILFGENLVKLSAIINDWINSHRK